MIGISGWEELFIDYQKEFKHISDTIDRRIYVDNVKVSPSPEHALDAFRYCPMDSVKLVILAQEPYTHDATGIAFSSNKTTASIRVLASWLGINNIDDMDISFMSWVKQGVLMINASMTIEVSDNPVSHKILWEAFIRGCLNICSKKIPHICFLLLGNVAESYSTSIKSGFIIKEKHPAYYARNNIYESKIDVFYAINDHLDRYGIKKIDFWNNGRTISR